MFGHRLNLAKVRFPLPAIFPILDDKQRHLIGCEYKQQGANAAIELGNQLATDEIRQQRLSAWQSFIQQKPESFIYCFRGGLRSKITQQWLAEQGHHCALIEGGYTALRRFLLEQLERLCNAGNVLIVSGTTGVGKTELVQSYPAAIDLEGRANHRGSAFGAYFSDQPSQINWENQIIVDWLKCETTSDLPVLIEAESHSIGNIHLPKPMLTVLDKAPTICA